MSDANHMTKEETAEWMGYETTEAMDAVHDKLHQFLCEIFGVPSYSLMEAEGIELEDDVKPLAWAEENAVLHVQRWLRMTGRFDG